VSRGDVQHTITAPGQLVATQEELLSFKVNGRLTELKVRPGSRVQAGELLAEIDPEPLIENLEQTRLELAQAEIEQAYQLAEANLNQQIAKARLTQAQARQPAVAAAQAELNAAQASLNQLISGPDENEITVTAAELRQSEVALKQAQWAYDQVAYAGDAGARVEASELEKATLDYEAKLAAYHLASREATEADITAAQARVAQAQADVDAALAELKAGQQELAVLENELEQTRLAVTRLEEGVDPLLKQAVTKAERELAQARLVAPFNGVVLEVLAKTGEMMSPDKAVLLMANPAAVEVRVTVIEEDLPLVQVGQPVELFFDAQPDAAIMGQVTRLNLQRVADEDRPLYYVYIHSSEMPDGVAAGMTADASIIVAQQQEVLRLPRALVRANSEGKAQVKVWENGRNEEREIQVGLRGDVYVEIVAGLSEHEQVIGE
jgi:HlyD family secretion protein